MNFETLFLTAVFVVWTSAWQYQFLSECSSKEIEHCPSRRKSINNAR